MLARRRRRPRGAGAPHRCHRPLEPGRRYVLDDAAATLLSDGGPLTSGTFRPSNVGAGDAFAGPAPAAPHGNPSPGGSATFASTFGGTDPNGGWNLFVVDDAGQDAGSVGSWCLVPTFATSGIQVDPASIAQTVAPGGGIVVVLDIDNVGSASLDWSITENCPEADEPWLAVAPAAGSTAPGGTSSVDVTLDATGLAAGTYEADLCIDSNDPDTPQLVVPVTLTVDSMPFLDGFESGDTSEWSSTQN